MSKNFWDERFEGKDFVYGQKPNAFFKAVLDLMHPGSILIPGEGEGRNALYAAQKGWTVQAFDSSVIGREKALKLASEHKVTVQYDISDYLTFQSDQLFDVIALIFTHLPSSDRNTVHKKYVDMLKPGGSIIMQTFNKEQINHNTGGPKSLDMLFSIEELQEDFNGLSSIAAVDEFIELDEGPYHQGFAHVISFRGIK